MLKNLKINLKKVKKGKKFNKKKKFNAIWLEKKKLIKFDFNLNCTKKSNKVFKYIWLNIILICF